MGALFFWGIGEMKNATALRAVILRNVKV